MAMFTTTRTKYALACSLHCIVFVLYCISVQICTSLSHHSCLDHHHQRLWRIVSEGSGVFLWKGFGSIACCTCIDCYSLGLGGWLLVLCPHPGGFSLLAIVLRSFHSVTKGPSRKRGVVRLDPPRIRCMKAPIPGRNTCLTAYLPASQR